MKITVTVRVESANPADEAGVYCRSDGHHRYDVLLAQNGTMRIRKGDELTGTVLATSSSPVGTAGSGARVTGVCTDSGAGVEIKALVDGRQVAVATDRNAPFRSGAAASSPAVRDACSTSRHQGDLRRFPTRPGLMRPEPGPGGGGSSVSV
ncbi:hypothetical protein [Actinomadura madurae]|uniref:hypothetical protein n=1 Tax=Actinomadura madurae TaxID=1993 RepID=UPI0020D226AD|nr:hypothetical protein [Actinomadura madurae]MCQ0015640.1 hypothetical protein [Actinomadura madurae]